MKPLDVIAGALVVVGAVNWGLVGVAQVDLVAALFGMRFGEVSAITAFVYALVGVAGLYLAVSTRLWLGRSESPVAHHAR
jgi:uncharacterized membrane protein YuzA (DUF378 family)